MPQTKREIGMSFNLDTSMAKARLASLYTQLNSINRLSKDLGRNGNFGLTNEIMRAISASTQLESSLGAAINPLTKNLDLTKFNNQLRMTGTNLETFKEAFMGLGTDGAAIFNNLTKSIAMAETPLLQTSKTASQLWQVLGNTVKWQATSSAIHGIMSTAASAMNYVKSLDSSLNSIQIVTGQTSEQMSRFATQANEAAKALNTTTNAYAKASLIYYQQGLSNKQVEERTATTIKLANVAGQSAKVVSDQLTAVWNNFYDGSKSLEYYADVMTALGATTASSTDEIAKGLSKFSSIAQTTGLSYEYATSALSTIVAATRQSADSVGTSLKTLFSRFQGLSLGETLDDGTALNKYSKALNTVGVSVLTANGQLRDMDNILADLGERWQNLSKAQQAALAQTIGGTRGYTTLMSLMDNWDSFEKNLETAQNAQGTLDAQAAIYAQSWEAASAHVRAASETIYSNLLDDNLIKGLTNGFGSILDIVGKTTNSLGGFGGTMMSLLSMGSRFFEPQMTEMFNNIAYSIGGREKAIEMQQKAIDDLTKPMSVSQFSEVNNLQTRINKNLQENLINYRKGVESGKIDQYLQPAYNQMMNTVETQGQAAIQAAQTFAMNEAQREYSGIMEQARLNVATTSNLDYIKQQYEKADLNMKTMPNNAKPEEVAEGQKNLAFWSNLYNNPGTNNIRQQETELFNLGSKTMADNAILSSYKLSATSNANINELQTIVGTTRTLVEGAKGKDEAETLANLEKTFSPEVAKGIMNIHDNTKQIKDISKLTQDEQNNLRQTILEATTLSPLGKPMDEIISDSIKAGATSYQDIRKSMEEEITERFGGGEKGEKLAKEYMDRLDSRLAAGSIDKYNKLVQEGKLTEAEKYLRGEYDKALNGTQMVSIGQGLTSITSSFASLGTTLLSANKAIQVFRDETSTTEQKVSSIVTTLGTMPMTISSIGKLSKNWGAQLGQTGITVGGLATSLGVAAAGAVALGVAIDNYNKGTQKTALSNFTAAMSTAAQMASEAQQKYEQLPVIQQSYNSLLNSYSQTQAGTLEQTRSLLAVNEAANNIIEEYGLEYGKDYSYGTGNQIMISAQSFENAQKNAEEQAQNAIYNQTYMRAMQQLIDADYHSYNEELTAEAEERLNKSITYQGTETRKDGWLSKPYDAQVEKTLTLEDALEQYRQYYYSPGIKTISDMPTFSEFIKNRYESEDAWTQLSKVLPENFDQKVTSIIQSEGFIDDLFDNSIIGEALSEIPSQNKLRQQAAAEEIVATIGQQMSTQEGIETDLAVAMATANSDQNIENWLKIGQIASNLSESTTGEIIGSWLNVAGVATEKDYYKMLTHKTDLEGISSDEIRATVLGEIIRIAGAQGGEGIKDIVGDELWENTFKNTFENFRGLNEYLQEAQTLGIPSILNSFKGLKVNTLNSELNKLTEKATGLRKEADQMDSNYYSRLYGSSRIESLRDQAQMLDNYAESIQTQADYIKSTVSQSLGYALGGTSVFTQDKDALGIYDELSEKYSLNELTSIGNYLTNARSFYGANTAETMYNLFNGANGSNVFKELSKVNWDTSLSGLASLSQLASRAGEGLNDFRELLDSAVKDVGGEGGIFNKLYNSSGFSKVLDKLETAYKVNGRITASDISKYAEKSEELYSYLQIGNTSDQLKMNSAGLAATLTAVNEGIITAEQVNSDVVRALSIAGQREANEAEAFEYVDNQDLGRSGGDIMKFFQGWGKAVYSAQVNNLAMDDPLMAVMNYMPAQVQQAYYESMKNGAGKTYQDLIRNNPALEEFDSLTQLLMGKKGKGGGTIKDVISAYGEMMGNIENPGITINEQLGSRWTREFAESLGLEWGKEYNIRDFTNYLGFDFGENNIGLYGERQGVEGKLGSTWLKTGMEEAFTALLGGNKEEAKALASIFLEDIHNSSSSYQVKQVDTQEAIEDLRTSNKSGQTFSDGGTGGQHFYNRATLEAIYSQSKGYLQDTEYGKTLDDFINHVLGDNGLLLDTSTSELFSEGLSQGTLTSLLDLQNQANDGQFQNMRDLLYSYGAIYGDGSNTGGVLDVNRWTDFVLATGGNAKIASDLLGFMDTQYLQDNGNFTLGTSFSDKFGRTYGLTQTEGETYEDFSKRVQSLQAVMNSGAITVAQYDENGKQLEGEDAYKTITDLTGFEAARLQGQEGYRWTEIDFGDGFKGWALTKEGNGTSPVNPSEWGSTSAPSDTTGTPPSSGGTSGTGGTTTPSTTSASVSPPNTTQPPPQGKFSNWSTDAERAAALAEFGGYDAASAKAKEAGFNGDMRGIMDYYAYTHEGVLSNWNLTPEQIAYADKKAYGNQYADANKRYSSRMNAQLQANARARADRLRAQQAVEAKERDKAFRKEQKEAAKRAKAEEDKRKADQAKEVRLRTLREERLRKKEEAIQAKAEEDKRKADQAEEVKKQTEINNLIENGYTIEEATNIANGVWTEAEVETARIQAQKETDEIVAAREAQEAETQNTVDYINSLMDEGYSQNIAEAIVTGEMTKEEADQIIAQGKLMMDARARDKGFEEGGQQLSPEEQEKRQNELAAKRAYVADEMGASNMLGATDYTEEEIRGVREGTITKEQIDTAREAKKQAEDAKKQAEENARASAALTEAAKLRAEEETKAAESAAAASEADQALYDAQMENAAQSWIEQNDLDQERANFTGSNVQFQNFVESRNLARDLEEQAFAAQEAAADLEDMGEDASEQYNKASDLAAQADKAGFTADQLNFQYNMTAEQRENFLEAAKTKVENGEQLSAFERQALTALGELVETSDGQYQLAKDAQEAEDNRTKNKSNVTTNEEGQLVDEETGEPVELPYEQPTQTSTPGYTPGTSSTDTGTPGSVDLSGPSSSSTSSSSSSSSTSDVTRNLGSRLGDYIYENGAPQVGSPVYVNGQQVGTIQGNDIDGYTVVDDKGNDISNTTPVSLFIGQNNARILQFAQGHMAVTGELGPELTIREDGTIDMLGQHGREYTWVNPNDIIYTAAQTTSILGNNNIEWLEGFAKGFNNKIHGYAPGYTGEAIAGETLTGSTDNPGGVNGFSGVGEAVRKGAYSGTYGGAMAAAEEEAKDPRYDPNTLKERDIVTRYFTILQQIDDITRQVEHFGKVAERAWGEERVTAIHQQTQAYKDQLNAQLTYQRQVEQYLQSDKDALTLMVEEFARDFREKISTDIFGGEASQQSVRSTRNFNIVSGGSYEKTVDYVTGAWQAATGQNNNIRPHAHGWISDSHSLVNGSLGANGTASGDPTMRTPINWTGAEYDANGVLTNYQEIVQRLMEVYNENAEAFAQDKEAQYKFQEMLKDIQFYTDTLNLYEQNQEVITDLRRTILDNQIREIVYKISFENELDMNQLKEINYQFNKVKDNAYNAADRIYYYATQLDYLDKQNTRTIEGIKDSLAAFSGNIRNGLEKVFDFTFYRKAPMEGYLGVDEENPLASVMNGEIYSDSSAGAYSAKEVLRINGSGGGVNFVSSDGSLNVPGLTAEEKKKLKIDYIDDETGFIYLNDGSWVDPKKRKRYRKKKSTGMEGAVASDGSMVTGSVGIVNKAISTVEYSDGSSPFKLNTEEENTYTDEYGIKHKGKKEKSEDNSPTSDIGRHLADSRFSGNNLYTEEQILGKIGGSRPATISTDGKGYVNYLAGDSAQKPDLLRLSSGELVAIGGTGGVNVIGGMEKQPGTSFPTGPVIAIGPGGSSYHLTDVNIGGNSIGDLGTLGLGSEGDDIEELPYFPTEYEINEYMKNFKAVKIGEETYYVPISDDVEVRDDITPAIKLDQVILNNKGELTKDMKELVTQQVQGWYDELVKLHPQLAVDIIPTYDKQGFMTNYREVMEKINEANAKMSDEALNLLMTDPQGFFDLFSKITDANINFEDMTTELVSYLESSIDSVYTNIDKAQGYAESAIQEIGTFIKSTYKELQSEISEYDFFGEVLTDYKNIIDLTNRQLTNIDKQVIQSLSDASFNNAVNKITGTKTAYEQQKKEYEVVKKQYDEAKANFESIKKDLEDQGMTIEQIKGTYTYSTADALLRGFKADLENANKYMEESEKDFLKSWEDALNKALDKYNAAMDEAKRSFDQSFDPIIKSIDAFQGLLERQRAMEDMYLDDYQRLHDLSALDRTIRESILDTDNLKSKERLRDMQKEINKLQEDGIKLSTYDLDILNKKLQVELARQALEDAKQAKSVVRLARDNNGNWSYVYTSNEEDVEDAKQNYEDAIYNMEKTTQDYAKNIQLQVAQITQQAQQELEAITPDSYNGDAQTQQMMRDSIIRNATESLRFIEEQMANAFGNNGWLNPFIEDVYGKNNHNLYENFIDTSIGKISNFNSLGDLIRNSEELLNGYNSDTLSFIDELYNDQKAVYDEAGVDIETAADYFNQQIAAVTEASDNEINKINELIDIIDYEFDRAIEALDSILSKYLDGLRTSEIMKMETLLSNLIDVIELSGRYEPSQRLDFASAVDTYEELEAIKQGLAKYGELLVTDYDDKGRQHWYQLQEGEAATAEQLTKWYDAAAKGDAIDVGDDLDTQEEYDKINAYLEKHGQVYISIDGELKKLSKDNEEDMAWLQDKLTAIQEAAKQMEQSVAYLGDYVSDGPGRDIAFYGAVEQTDKGATVWYNADKTGPGYTYDAETGKNTPFNDTGGYTGRWQGAVYADTGMYTGEWDGGSERRNGRLAWLHQKELVLNAHDTENFLDAMNIVRQLDNLASWMANGLGDLFMPKVEGNDETLEQNVHIEASFPNAVDHNEIEQAFGNLVNLASQYANRKAFA